MLPLPTCVPLSKLLNFSLPPLCMQMEIIIVTQLFRLRVPPSKSLKAGLGKEESLKEESCYFYSRDIP